MAFTYKTAPLEPYSFMGEKVNPDAIAEKVLESFSNSKQFWQDPALDWEDLKQQAWAVFLEKYKLLRRGHLAITSSLSGWTYSVMKSAIGDYLRLSGPIHVTKWAIDNGESLSCWYLDHWVEGEDGEYSSAWERYTDTVEPAERLIESLESQSLVLERCRAVLSPKEAELTLLHIGAIGPSGGMTRPELATHYRTSTSTIRKVLMQAFKRLRDDHQIRTEWDARTIRWSDPLPGT